MPDKQSYDVDAASPTRKGASSMTENGYGLTIMEVKVLKLLENGLTRKEIGDRLNISVDTVNFHLENSYRKLGVRNEGQAVGKLLRENILPISTVPASVRRGNKKQVIPPVVRERCSK